MPRAGGTTVEQWAADCLSRLPEAGDLADEYDEFIRESGLFREPAEGGARLGEAVPGQRLRYLAAELGQAGPLSEVILEE